QTRAIDGHAVADSDRHLRTNRQRAVAGRDYFACLLDNTREHSFSTSAGFTNPGISVKAFAAPQATPSRIASGIPSPRANATAIPANIASPDPIVFRAFTRGGTT